MTWSEDRNETDTPRIATGTDWEQLSEQWLLSSLHLEIKLCCRFKEKKGSQYNVKHVLNLKVNVFGY